MSKEEVEKIKIVLIGDAGVGKSCIISTYFGNEFNENMPPSLGVSSLGKHIKIGDKKVLLSLWDTAGQEIFHSLIKNFYKDTCVICLVYDITKKNSFYNLKSEWYKDIQKNGRKNVILAVVGNKCDLFKSKEVDEEDAREFAEKIGAIFMLTSAKNNASINELFEYLAEKYLSPEYESIVNEIKKERASSFNLNDGKNDGCCKKKKCC